MSWSQPQHSRHISASFERVHGGAELCEDAVAGQAVLLTLPRTAQGRMLRSAIARTAVPARSAAFAARRTYVNLAPISNSRATSSGSRAAGHVKTDQGTEFKMDLQKEVRRRSLDDQRLS